MTKRCRRFPIPVFKAIVRIAVAIESHTKRVRDSFFISHKFDVNYGQLVRDLFLGISAAAASPSSSRPRGLSSTRRQTRRYYHVRDRQQTRQHPHATGRQHARAAPMKGTAGGSGGGLMGISILAVVVLGIIIGFVSWFLLGGYKGSRPVLATPTPAPVLSTATPPSPTAGLTPPTPPTAQSYSSLSRFQYHWRQIAPGPRHRLPPAGGLHKYSQGAGCKRF